MEIIPDELSITEASSKIVTQSNVITSARYDFDSTQIDIISMIISQLERTKQGVPRVTYSISLKDMAELTNKSLNHQQLRGATENLGNRPFNIKHSSDRYQQIWMFQSVVYILGEARIEITLSEAIIPYLFDLKDNFTRFRLVSSLGLNSKYAKRFYQFACQWKNVGTIIKTIDEIKIMLDLKDPTGKKKEEYTNITTFKTRVLETAKKEINQNTDIHFDYKMIKIGRNYRKIKFIIGTRELSKIQLPIDFKESVETQKQIKAITAYGISEHTAKVIAKRGYKVWEQAVNDVKEAIRTKKLSIEIDMASYLIGIMKNKGILPKSATL